MYFLIALHKLFFLLKCINALEITFYNTIIAQIIFYRYIKYKLFSF